MNYFIRGIKNVIRNYNLSYNFPVYDLSDLARFYFIYIYIYIFFFFLLLLPIFSLRQKISFFPLNLYEGSKAKRNINYIHYMYT